MSDSELRDEQLCQCPMGIAKCEHPMSEEDLLCESCRKIHKPLFPSGLSLPAEERIFRQDGPDRIFWNPGGR